MSDPLTWNAHSDLPLSDPQQGPCGNGERFGFDTDKLEATCVSLEEAGLEQAAKTYVFQYMSFPATESNKYQHYEVREFDC